MKLEWKQTLIGWRASTPFGRVDVRNDRTGWRAIGGGVHQRLLSDNAKDAREEAEQILLAKCEEFIESVGAEG